jgi:F-type H+-transporting ATPase subunit b
MPQLDPTWFGTQLFWLAVSFVVLYLLLRNIALPKVASVLQAREDKIKGDLDQAQKLKEQAEATLEAYRKALADARTEAQRLQREVTDAAAAEAARQQAEIAQRIAAQVTEAERRIAEQRTQAIAGLQTVAVDVAQAAVSRLTGGAVDGQRLAAAVERAAQGVTR